MPPSTGELENGSEHFPEHPSPRASSATDAVSATCCRSSLPQARVVVHALGSVNSGHPAAQTWQESNSALTSGSATQFAAQLARACIRRHAEVVGEGVRPSGKNPRPGTYARGSLSTRCRRRWCRRWTERTSRRGKWFAGRASSAKVRWSTSPPNLCSARKDCSVHLASPGGSGVLTMASAISSTFAAWAGRSALCIPALNSP